MVRFYEKEGLINPIREDNGYGDYSEEDVIKSYFSFGNYNGKNYDFLPTFIRNVIIAFSLTGCILCLMRGSWTLKNFVDGFIGVGAIILVEMVLSVPLYFLGKRFEWVRKTELKHYLLLHYYWQLYY